MAFWQWQAEGFQHQSLGRRHVGSVARSSANLIMVSQEGLLFLTKGQMTQQQRSLWLGH